VWTTSNKRRISFKHNGQVLLALTEQCVYCETVGLKSDESSTPPSYVELLTCLQDQHSLLERFFASGFAVLAIGYVSAAAAKRIYGENG
jgi:hypothetical protein